MQGRWQWRSVGTGLALFLFSGLAVAQQPNAPFKGGQLQTETPARREVSQWSVLVRLPTEIAGRPGANLQDGKAEIKRELANQANRTLMDKVLQWYLFRLTWEEMQEGRVPEDDVKTLGVAATMHEHMTELLGDRGASNARRVLPAAPSPVPSPWLSQTPREPPTADQVLVIDLQNAFMEEVRPLVLKYLKEVLDNQNLIARLNAVRVLDHFAAFGQDAVAPELLAILQNPNEHDAVKYYAILGLGKLFEYAADKDKKTFKGDKGIEQYRLCAKAVLEWLDKQTKYDPVKLELMTEGERQAISLARRAAIQALGETRRAMLVDGDEVGTGRGGPLAELLLRIVANKEKTVQPPPTWNERVLAAKAVCRLDPKLSPSYQPDYTAYAIAQFINEMANSSRDGDTTTWSLYASELKGSFDALATLLPAGTPGTEYVQKTLQPVVNPVLEHIYDRNRERGAPQQLLKTLEGSKPPSKELYKTKQP